MFQRVMIFSLALSLVLVSELAGADSVSTRLNDLWSYDPGNDTWEELAPNTTSTTAPGVRKYQSICYDSLRDRVYLFGGTNPPGVFLNDAWAFDVGTSRTWTRLYGSQPANGIANMVSYNAAAFYDRAMDRVVMPQFNNTICLFAPDTCSFTRVPGSLWTPSNGSYPAFAYDDLRQRIYCFGGSGTTLKNSVDTYDFNPGTTGTAGWHTLATSGPKPPARWLTEAAVDTARNKLVVFGGNLLQTMETYNEYTDDTYELDLDSLVWTRLQAPRKPYCCGQMAMCFDAFRQQSIAFGGLSRVAQITAADFSCYNDIWMLDSSGSWVMGMPSGHRPALRRLPAMTYDTLRHSMVVFGGEQIISGASIRTEIQFPQTGSVVSGDSVLVQALRVFGDESITSQVLFQYRFPAQTGVWQDIVTSSTEHPNPVASSPYFIHWDTTATSGDVDLRAVAFDTNGTIDALSPIVTITVSLAEADTSGTEDGVVQLAAAGRSSDVGAGDTISGGNMIFRLPRGSLGANTTVRALFLDSPSSGGGGLRLRDVMPGVPVGRMIRLSAATGQSALLGSKPMTLLCPFTDHDQDGLVDGTAIRVSTLRVYAVETGGAYVPLPCVIDLPTGMVRATSTSLGDFVLLGSQTSSGVDDWRQYR